MPLPPGTLGQALDQIPQFMLMLGRMQEERREGERRDDLLTQRVREFDAQEATQERREERQEMLDFQGLIFRMSDKTAREELVRGFESDNPEVNKFIVDILPALAVGAANQRAAFDLEKRTREERILKPDASDVAYARKRMGEFQEDINEANNKIALMRQDWKLDPGETPKKKKDIANWDKAHLELAMAQMSLDNLRKESAGRGIDLEFGAPALLPPGQLGGMSDEEVLRMIQGVGVR